MVLAEGAPRRMVWSEFLQTKRPGVVAASAGEVCLLCLGVPPVKTPSKTSEHLPTPTEGYVKQKQE